MAMAPTTELANLLSDLRIVKPHLVARRADLLAQRTGKATFAYAVDTNIMYFIGQPITKILSQPKLKRELGFFYQDKRRQIPHIGSLFRNDDEHYHLAIGAALAQFIGFQLAGTSPLLLPDALWPEAATMLANFSLLDDPEILKVADELFHELERRTIAKLEAKLEKAGLNPRDLAPLLRTMVAQKIGRHEGLRRLEALFDGGAIEELGARPVAGASHLLGLSGQGRKLGDLRDELGHQRQSIFKKWDKKLEDHGKEEPHRKLDAEALTQIEMRNLLARAQGSIERTLYITVDSAVILAAEDLHLDDLGCSFAEAYIRHPAAFLNDIGLGVGRTSAVSEAKSDSEPVSILDWVDVMLNKSSGQSVTHGADVSENLARHAVADISRSWQELSAVQEDQLFFQFGIEQIERSLHDRLGEEDLARAIADLQDEVIEEEAKAWESCFRVAIQLALRIQPGDYQRPTRSAPPICFEAWDNAGEAIEQFKIWGARGLTSQTEYEAVRKQLEEDGEDKSGYAYFLASSAFFAARGDWAPAAGLASFAREQAFRHSVDQRKGANGREATYFEAVARRHLVRHSGELARSVELIEECQRIYTDEKEAWPGRLAIVPERFALELLDIHQAKLLFQWDADKDHDAVRTGMTALLDDYQALQAYLQHQVDQVVRGKTPMLLGSEAYVLVQTEVRAIISALLLVAVGEIELSQKVRTALAQLLARLPHLHQAASSKRRGALALAETQDGSMLAEVAVAVVETLLDRASGRRVDHQRLRAARLALDARVLKSHRTFPFDRKRFNRMRDLLSDRPAS